MKTFTNLTVASSVRSSLNKTLEVGLVAPNGTLRPERVTFTGPGHNLAPQHYVLHRPRALQPFQLSHDLQYLSSWPEPYQVLPDYKQTLLVDFNHRSEPDHPPFWLSSGTLDPAILYRIQNNTQAMEQGLSSGMGGVDADFWLQGGYGIIHRCILVQGASYRHHRRSHI